MSKNKKVKMDARKCVACKTCELECAIIHSNKGTMNDALSMRPRPIPRMKIILDSGKTKIQRCAQCKKPKCVEACERHALHIEDGIIILDDTKCDGCWKCIEACTLKALFKNEVSGTVIKCDLCRGKDRIACVESCPTEALVFMEQ